MSGAPERRTRGRTSPSRLRALDAYLLHCERPLLERQDGPWGEAAFLDVGFGEHPWTTLESARRFRALNPSLRVIGVEADPGRASAAASHEEERTHFRQGGFGWAREAGQPVRLIRAMNILRQYRAEEAGAAHEELGQALLPGGLLVEGSTDGPGGITVAYLLRRGAEGLAREALLFHTDFHQGFAPRLFRDWLPVDWRRRMVPGSALHAFFAAWTAAWAEARAQGADSPADSFHEGARRLSQAWPGVSAEPWLWENGYLRWQPPTEVPRPQGL
ncbi:methylase [Stigmatella sp. ncwal1]|uniref:Methylase n=1 Tax=Stigmatella ashevillensis TaxID=2995309 RepID=A0ABT5DEV9_9BACT|nr:methylase [Stigmatella ashevillena]MDC0712177.1 methylase [Stigmatella ashevillena]